MRAAERPALSRTALHSLGILQYDNKAKLKTSRTKKEENKSQLLATQTEISAPKGKDKHLLTCEAAATGYWKCVPTSLGTVPPKSVWDDALRFCSPTAPVLLVC